MAKKIVTLQLDDGKEISLSLDYASMFKIEHSRPEAYSDLNDAILSGKKDFRTVINAIYGAYLCANADNIDECMNKKEFIEVAPSPSFLFVAFKDLMGDPKKK